MNTAREAQVVAACGWKIEGFRLKVMAAVVEALEDERNLVIAGKKNRADMACEPNSARVVAACGWET